MAAPVEPELEALLGMAAAHPGALPPIAELVPRFTALQLRVEAPGSGGAWRRQPSALGSPALRARLLDVADAWLAAITHTGPVHVVGGHVFITIMLAYFVCLVDDGPEEVLQRHSGRTLLGLLEATEWVTGCWEPADGLLACARMCSVVRLVSLHAGASARLLASADGSRVLERLVAFCCRSLALHHDQAGTRPPVPGEARAALACLKALAATPAAAGDAGAGARAVLVVRAAVRALHADVFSGAAAAVVGELVRNSIATPPEAARALACGLFEPVLKAAEAWPRSAAAQTQLLSALFNFTCHDLSRRALGVNAALVVRAGRCALAALVAHVREPDVLEAALRVLLHPVSSCLGVEAAGAAWIVEEDGMTIMAGAMASLLAARQWRLLASAASVLASWLRNPACRARLDEPLYAALCAACRACRAPDVPDGLRIALSAALGGFSRHVPHGQRVQEALALMEDDQEAAAAAALPPAAAA